MIGLSFFRRQYNDSVEKLLVANADCVDHNDVVPDPPLTANPLCGPHSDVALRQLLYRVTSVLTKCLNIRKATGDT
jgi:hypothetical protein